MNKDCTINLRKLCTCFLEENSKLNLSAFRDEETCWHGNILDSIEPLACIEKYIDTNTPFRCVDIGTGGGFPLLPLSLILPEGLWTGIDSTQKKIDAIGRICDAMEINNVELLCGRLEDIGRDPQYREQFDCLTARAVAPLNTLLEYASPLVKPGGYLFSWKSMTLDQELHDSLLARAELSCSLEHQWSYTLPGDWGKRQIVVFHKRAPIHKKYPREVGIPKKTPLL